MECNLMSNMRKKIIQCSYQGLESIKFIMRLPLLQLFMK